MTRQAAEPVKGDAFFLLPGTVQVQLKAAGVWKASRAPLNPGVLQSVKETVPGLTDRPSSVSFGEAQKSKAGSYLMTGSSDPGRRKLGERRSLRLHLENVRPTAEGAPFYNGLPSPLIVYAWNFPSKKVGISQT